MPTLFNSPALLLICVGALLGLNFPLGKLAGQAGVPALWWATLISASAALVLGALVVLRRRATPLNTHYLRYFGITAVISYALPNALMFAALPHLGSGLTALFLTLSPMLTVGLSALVGIKRPRRLELAGIALGLVGAMLVVSGRGEVGRPAEFVWLAAACLVPVCLACGNVYRTADWPAQADPLWLAVGSNAVAAALLLIVALATSDLHAIALMAGIPFVSVAQIIASALFYLLFFRLQRAAGPVTLSQIGTVAAGVGVCIGAAVLGERYAAVVWIGVAVITSGLALTVAARYRR